MLISHVNTDYSLVFAPIPKSDLCWFSRTAERAVPLGYSDSCISATRQCLTCAWCPGEGDENVISDSEGSFVIPVHDVTAIR